MSAIEQNFDGIVDADGLLTIEIRPTTNLRPWNVTQVSVEMPTAANSVRCTLRKNGNYITPLAPRGDAAAGDPPVKLTTSDVMTIEWSGATPGDVGLVFIIYDEETR